MDITDYASEREEQQLAEALARHQRAQAPAGAGSLECVDCGEPIPVKRREALPGCETCVDCQSVREARR